VVKANVLSSCSRVGPAYAATRGRASSSLVRPKNRDLRFSNPVFRLESAAAPQHAERVKHDDFASIAAQARRRCADSTLRILCRRSTTANKSYSHVGPRLKIKRERVGRSIHSTSTGARQIRPAAQICCRARLSETQAALRVDTGQIARVVTLNPCRRSRWAIWASGGLRALCVQFIGGAAGDSKTACHENCKSFHLVLRH
jgi:hypothetical protein